jgi:DNA-directed RNA polymerase specialized sigma24 family protein
MDLVINRKERIYKFFEDRQNYKMLFAICRHYYLDIMDAEDATQQIIVNLAGKADKINFPEDRTAIYVYLKKAVYTYKLEDVEKANRLPVVTDEAELLMREDEKSVSCGQKLENLHARILENAHLFTPMQLKVWEFMYRCEDHSVAEIADILNTDIETVYALRTKVKVKIRRYFSEEDLY